MIKEIKVIDEQRNILRVTTVDERWYSKPGTDPRTGLPTFEFFPSSTWIAGYYPKGIHFYKWLANTGWDESQAIKQAAGNRGSKVHQSIEILEKAFELPIETVLQNPETGIGEQLATDELDCILSFSRWHKEAKPELLATEMVVFGDGYAGTLDRIYRIDGEIWIVDFKTSASIWEEYKLQVSSYNHAEIDFKSLGITEEEWSKRKMAILQVGYKLNKNGYKFTEFDDKYDLFQTARKIWANENPEAKPKQKDYPLIIRLEKENKNG